MTGGCGGFAWTMLATGPVAGAVSATVFAGVHALVIGPIWFFLVPMLIAGAVCGLLLAVTFGLLVGRPSVPVWLLYNATFVGLFALLAVAYELEWSPFVDLDDTSRGWRDWADGVSWLSGPLRWVEDGLGTVGITALTVALAVAMFAKGYRRAAVFAIGLLFFRRAQPNLADRL